MLLFLSPMDAFPKFMKCCCMPKFYQVESSFHMLRSIAHRIYNLSFCPLSSSSPSSSSSSSSSSSPRVGAAPQCDAFLSNQFLLKTQTRPEIAPHPSLSPQG